MINKLKIKQKIAIIKSRLQLKQIMIKTLGKNLLDIHGYGAIENQEQKSTSYMPPGL